MYLKVRNVKKKYKDKEVLKGINFDVEKGEIFCILGPSGCGKTTLLNIIGGFIDDFEGRIELSDEDITKLAPEKRPIATVFQSYGLFPHKDVLENVTYGLKFTKVSKKEAVKKGEEVLEKVGLLGYENKKIGELSGGEQQRVAMARSLILKPKVLLLDEPFSNIDPNLKVILRKEVKRIQEEFGVTMIIVTHDQEDAFYLADRVGIMNNGKLVQIGTSRDIYKNPKGNFVANFIGENNSIDGEYLRPENIEIYYDEVGEYEIIEKIFSGLVVNYTIRKDNQVLKCTRLSSEKELEVGDKVRVEFIKEKME